ncbi:MAG: hypothetical protein FJ406_04730 [Verrucomicrobia bacterium]|nr:hypothetical protein [Verrucomicrobiota bacterium]MBM3869444.1 hypothetical protein [Verrucomicrobiota bacterium]
MQVFVDAVAAELERPRALLKQVVDHLASHYSVSRDELGAFFTDRLSTLEDYEIDLLFSPVFTPTLTEQAAFSDLLDRQTLPAAAWPELIRRMADRPTVTRLLTEDGTAHAIRLHEVSLERFVTRLNLDVVIPDPLGKLLHSLPPPGDRALLKALARRIVWNKEPRREILFRYLLAATSEDFYQRDDLLALLKLMETYQPKDAPDLLGRIPHWQEVLKQEITAAASPKPFFAARVQELHGGGRDQRHQDNTMISGKQRELEFLGRLKGVLAA